MCTTYDNADQDRDGEKFKVYGGVYIRSLEHFKEAFGESIKDWDLIDEDCRSVKKDGIEDWFFVF
jgi:hypothetical protein